MTEFFPDGKTDAGNTGATGKQDQAFIWPKISRSSERLSRLSSRTTPL